MDPYERNQIADVLKDVNVGANEYVIKEGDKGDRFYIVVKGSLVATKRNPEGHEKSVKEYKTGDYFGELALLKDVPRQASVMALVHFDVILDRLQTRVHREGGLQAGHRAGGEDSITQRRNLQEIQMTYKARYIFMNPTYLWTGFAAAMLATYTVSYKLGKRYSESQYYLERKRHDEPYKYMSMDEEVVVPNIQLIRYPRFKVVYSNVSTLVMSGPQDPFVGPRANNPSRHRRRGHAQQHLLRGAAGG